MAYAPRSGLPQVSQGNPTQGPKLVGDTSAIAIAAAFDDIGNAAMQTYRNLEPWFVEMAERQASDLAHELWANRAPGDPSIPDFQRRSSAFAPGRAFNEAVERGISSRASVEFRDTVNQLGTEFSVDPQGFEEAAAAARDEMLGSAPPSIANELEMSFDEMIGREQAQITERAMQIQIRETDAADMLRLDQIQNEIQSGIRLYGPGFMETPAGVTLHTEFFGIVGERIDNPHLAVPAEFGAEMERQWRNSVAVTSTAFIANQRYSETGSFAAASEYAYETLDSLGLSNEEYARADNVVLGELRQRDADRNRAEAAAWRRSRADASQMIAMAQLGQADDVLQETIDRMQQFEQGAEVLREFYLERDKHDLREDVLSAVPGTEAEVLDRFLTEGRDPRDEVELLAQYNAALSARATMINRDPVAFLLENSPGLAALAEAATEPVPVPYANAGEVDNVAMENYVAQLRAAQRQWNIPPEDQAIMSEPQRNQWLNNFSVDYTEPGAAQLLYDRVQSFGHQWGQYASLAFAELEANGLDARVNILARTANTRFERTGGAVATASTSDLRESVSARVGDSYSDFVATVEEAARPYLDSINVGEVNGLSYRNSMLDNIATVTGMAIVSNQYSDNEVRRAARDVAEAMYGGGGTVRQIGNSYVRIPAEYRPRDVENFLTFAQTLIEPDQIIMPGGEGLEDDARAGLEETYIRSLHSDARWQTNPQGDGVYLLNQNLSPVLVDDGNGGQEIFEVKFDQMFYIPRGLGNLIAERRRNLRRADEPLPLSRRERVLYEQYLDTLGLAE